MEYSGYTYEELKSESEILKRKYNDLEDSCASKGYTFEEFKEKSLSLKESLYFIDKYERQKCSPVVEYGKEWRGELITLEAFINLCKRKRFVDGNGIGYYATENSKSDIIIIPSDILENIYRDDFTHVIWFEHHEK